MLTTVAADGSKRMLPLSLACLAAVATSGWLGAVCASACERGRDCQLQRKLEVSEH